MGNSHSESDITTPPSPEHKRCDCYGNYTIVRELSSGGFGLTMLTNRQDDPSKEYTLKIIPHQQDADEIKIIQALRGELGVTQYVEHFYCTTHNKTSIVTEYVPGKELFQYIIDNGALTEDQCKDVFKQLCTIMDSVHIKGIVHRDLKTENILINDQLKVTIIDWGLAFFPKQTEKRRSCGSPYYVAPEVISSIPCYNGPEIDVWSLGVVLYAMLTAKLPFNDDNINKLFKNIKSCKVDYERKGLAEDAIVLLQSIFVLVDRSTLADILCSEWISPPNSGCWYLES